MSEALCPACESIEVSWNGEGAECLACGWSGSSYDLIEDTATCDFCGAPDFEQHEPGCYLYEDDETP